MGCRNGAILVYGVRQALLEVEMSSWGNRAPNVDRHECYYQSQCLIWSSRARLAQDGSTLEME